MDIRQKDDIRQNDIRQKLQAYARRDNRLAALSFFSTLAVYAGSLGLAVRYADLWLLLLAMMLLHAFASVRLYVLQHDCGHASLFSSKFLNDLAGQVLSLLTFAPYVAMRHNHNLHHAHLGNLAARDSGEIHTMTLAEWQVAGFWPRLQYRLYRNPFILIPLGSLFTYFIRYRWPKNAASIGPWAVILHNLAIAAYVAALYVWFGAPGLLIWFLSSFFGGMIGVFLVYLQHNFEDTHWDRKPDLDPRVAALQGSSALDLGWWLDLGSGNIAYHDIHHFNANIPSYRLRRCHQDIRDEFSLRLIGWPEALSSFGLKLWDEQRGKLVRFPD